jgi:cytochrome c oxidase subunit II
MSGRAGNQRGAAGDRDGVLRFRSDRWARVVLSAAATTALVIAAAACSGGSDGTADPAASLSPAAANGLELARSRGCAGCHGQNWQGGAGPGWIDLAGSEVALADGTTTIADEDYLTRAIADPSADRREGYSLRMPANNLSDGEIADIVAFIESLSSGAAGSAMEQSP